MPAKSQTYRNGGHGTGSQQAAKSKRNAPPARRDASPPDPARPFDPAVLARAADIAAAYRVVVWSEDGEFYGRGLEVPDAMNDGKTADECVRNVRDILTTHLAAMIERGESPPRPASEQVRSEQVNLRLTAEEKATLETAARRLGFRGVSDFIRSAALAGARP